MARNFRHDIKKEALREAKRISNVLVKQFGAKEVILYGSLAEEKYFDVASDIDLAVKGLGDEYFKAFGYVLRMNKFDIDIRPYEDMPAAWRKKVIKEGRYLYEKK